jgi:hypothetical protein
LLPSRRGIGYPVSASQVLGLSGEA